MKKVNYFNHRAQEYKSTLVVGSYVDKLGDVFYVVDITLSGVQMRLAFKKLSSVTDFINCNLK